MRSIVYEESRAGLFLLHSELVREADRVFLNIGPHETICLFLISIKPAFLSGGILLDNRINDVSLLMVMNIEINRLGALEGVKQNIPGRQFHTLFIKFGRIYDHFRFLLDGKSTASI